MSLRMHKMYVEFRKSEVPTVFDIILSQALKGFDSSCCYRIIWEVQSKKNVER